jgi:hypothetical protein
MKNSKNFKISDGGSIEILSLNLCGGTKGTENLSYDIRYLGRDLNLVALECKSVGFTTTSNC